MDMENQSRRQWLKRVGIGVVIAAVGNRLTAQPTDTAVTVYKDPNCGCCKKWVTHLESNGFKVTAVDRNDMSALKDSLSVPSSLRSCHTAVVGKLIVEGHVPASDVRKAMTRVSKSMIGVAVPGMPSGSPGMEMGARKDRYEVIAFDASGATKVFATHG
jgi:hypothetical protein